MKKHKFLLMSLLIEVAVIASIAIGCQISKNSFYIFYNLIYGIILSTFIPIWLTYKESGTLESLGIKKLGIRQIIITIGFIIFSIGGQLIPLNFASLNFGKLAIGAIPLIMTTFFEEFLLRGFMQTRFEKQYGWIPAVLISGFLFSIYHIAYPGFRTIQDLLILFAVGIGFALSFKLSKGNVIVSFCVNLPNAFLTYVIKYDQFPKFDIFSSIIAGITIILIAILLLFFIKNNSKHKKIL